MPRDAPQPDGFPNLDVPISPVIRSEGLVFTAGQVAVAADFDEEAHAVLRNVGACLAAAGCSYADVLNVNVYIRDLADFDAFNEIYRSYFEAPFPARTTVRVDLLGSYRVEVSAVARVPGASISS
jgi:enamine deaminase RidA (YjgF/YER057c/UK114 family)